MKKDRKIILEFTPEEIKMLAYGAMPRETKEKLMEVAYYLDERGRVEKKLKEDDHTEIKKPTKRYDLNNIRQKFPKAYAKWSTGEDIKLENEFKNGKSIEELSDSFQRKPGGIRSRLIKLNLIKE